MVSSAAASGGEASAVNRANEASKAAGRSSMGGPFVGKGSTLAIPGRVYSHRVRSTDRRIFRRRPATAHGAAHFRIEFADEGNL